MAEAIREGHVPEWLEAQRRRRAARRYVLPGVTDVVLHRERVCDQAAGFVDKQKLARFASEFPAPATHHLFDTVGPWLEPPKGFPGAISPGPAFTAVEREAMGRWLAAAAEELAAPLWLTGRLLALPTAQHLMDKVDKERVEGVGIALWDGVLYLDLAPDASARLLRFYRDWVAGLAEIAAAQPDPLAVTVDEMATFLKRRAQMVRDLLYRLNARQAGNTDMDLRHYRWTARHLLLHASPPDIARAENLVGDDVTAEAVGKAVNRILQCV